MDLPDVLAHLDLDAERGMAMTRRRRSERRPNRTLGHALHVVVAAVRRLVEAIRHVRTGGATARRRAIRSAAAAPQKCPTCRQPMPHSADWRDHLHQ